MHGSFIWGQFSLKLSPHKFQLLLRRWLKQFSENINRLPEFNMISMSPSSLNLNINRFVIFLPLYTWIIVPHASWTFFYTVAMNMMYALLSDTVSRLPVSTLNIGNMSHKQDLREFLDFVSIFGTNMDNVGTDCCKWITRYGAVTISFTCSSLPNSITCISPSITFCFRSPEPNLALWYLLCPSNEKYGTCPEDMIRKQRR